jgi:anti-sigma factor RsiW
MRCATSRRWISGYQDGELGRWRRRRLGRHLDSCMACRAELEADQRIWALLEGAEVVEAPDVMSRLERRLGERATVSPAPWWQLAPAYAAAVVLCAAVGSVGGMLVAGRLSAPAGGASDPEYAGFLEDVPPGLGPVASVLQTERTR